jgi:hypothetical protein
VTAVDEHEIHPTPERPEIEAGAVAQVLLHSIAEAGFPVFRTDGRQVLPGWLTPLFTQRRAIVAQVQRVDVGLRRLASDERCPLPAGRPDLEDASRLEVGGDQREHIGLAMVERTGPRAVGHGDLEIIDAREEVLHAGGRKPGDVTQGRDCGTHGEL